MSCPPDLWYTTFIIKIKIKANDIAITEYFDGNILISKKTVNKSI